MAGFSTELVLATGYAAFLAIIAFVLELIARRMHQRTRGLSTVGFTYHPDRDVWSCPRDQHLFPVFSDRQRGKIVYRAPASVCNACPSKAACTDSNTGRVVERLENESVESGMLRFHRVFSFTLLLLSGLIVAIEFFRTHASQPRTVLAVMFLILFSLALRLSSTIRFSTPEAQASALKEHQESNSAATPEHTSFDRS